ncbi:hypothetical protein [Rickettsiella endosymbiont of Rhagonycha lignosa]|uniref:hypothetical protein n=1 Tax=Rickettsiella endosymbiont of Rhagonycha lignosa TaxID=3077937 RepID=UPI00313EA1ED
MPNSNNKDREPLEINFSASHDQASVQDESASKYKNLNAIIPTLEKIQEDLEIYSETHSSEKLQRQLNETKAEVINLVTYARQIVSDLQEGAKKFSTIHLHTPDEKLKHAKSLLATHKSLTANEKYRFKKIEDALSNTCIIKSAGDETVKFQLGILGYAKDSNMITESEFIYLVVPRLKDNNLLDSYRLRVEGDMILKRTPLEICQSINKDLSSDDDYKASKNLFMARLKGIDYELSVHQCNNPRDMVQLKEELTSGVPAHSGTHPSTQNFENHSEENSPPFPEVPDDSLELNSQQPFNEPTINIYPIEEYQKKSESEFVALMQELIPANKKNEKIQTDEINPIPVEKIMKMTLQRPSPLSDDKKRNIIYSEIMKAEKIIGKAVAKVKENIEKQRTSTDGTYVYEEMIESLSKLKDEHAEQFQKTESCKSTGKPLIEVYDKFGKDYLEEKIQKYKTAINNLKDSKKGEYGEFSKHNPKYSNLKKDERKKTLNRIYDHKETIFNTELEKAKKQQALWLGEKTFTQSVEKNGKIKQEEKSFPEEELHFRNLVLDFNSNSASKGETINVYTNGVYLTSNKKAEDIQSSIQISNTRTLHKNYIPRQTSSNFYSVPNKKEENHRVAMAFRS